MGRGEGAEYLGYFLIVGGWRKGYQVGEDEGIKGVLETKASPLLQIQSLKPCITGLI